MDQIEMSNKLQSITTSAFKKKKRVNLATAKGNIEQYPKPILVKEMEKHKVGIQQKTP